MKKPRVQVRFLTPEQRNKAKVLGDLHKTLAKIAELGKDGKLHKPSTAWMVSHIYERDYRTRRPVITCNCPVEIIDQLKDWSIKLGVTKHKGRNNFGALVSAYVDGELTDD
jgi:hypothetical protein